MFNAEMLGVAQILVSAAMLVLILTGISPQRKSSQLKLPHPFVHYGYVLMVVNWTIFIIKEIPATTETTHAVAIQISTVAIIVVLFWIGSMYSKMWHLAANAMK